MIWIFGIYFTPFIVSFCLKKGNKKERSNEKLLLLCPSRYISNNIFCCGKCFTYTFYLYIYVYVIWGRLYGFETQGKCEILQRERELVRVFLAHFSFFFLILLYLKFGGFSNFERCQIFIGGGGTYEKASQREEAKINFSCSFYYHTQYYFFAFVSTTPSTLYHQLQRNISTFHI